MDAERWKQIEELYNAALACESKERSALLDRADPEIKREVEQMLGQGGSLLDRPAWEGMGDATVTMLAAGKRLGRYEIEARVGAGGMGEVFRARDTRLNRLVALKVSRIEFTERFEREARAIAALNHPKICTLYDVGPNYLVMELVEGETLAARLKAGKLSIEQTIGYGSEIADALAAAHSKGVIHRDLKPGNIMLTKSGVKVLDFGLAKSAQDETLTLANVVMGTPAYMAPEQREGKPCDARADIYSLGLVLSEMATGKRTATGERPLIDPLPDALTHLVERCLAQDPEDRWQSARDVKFELDWMAKAAGNPPPASGSARTWPWFILTAVASFALAGLALVYLLEPFLKPAAEARATYATILPPPKTSFAFTKNLGPAALSPDGRTMVFAATGEDGKSQLWLRPMDTLEARPLPGTEDGTFPFWSPDNRWIGFFADRMLMKIDTRGGPPIALAEALAGRGGSWSSKGTIVFAPTVFAPLLKISSEGGATKDAVESDAAMGTAHGFPWFLPDGEHFLFVSWGGAGRMNLGVGSLSSTASKVVGETDSNAAYSEGRLLYLRENTLMAQPFDSKSLRANGEAAPVAERVDRFLDLIEAGAFSVSTTGLLAYQSGEVAGARQLTWFDREGKPAGTIGEPRKFFDIQLSPDGKSLLASAPDSLGNYDFWMYDLARGLPTRFTFDPGGEYWAVWSPDGKSVLFNSTRQGPYDLYRKSANGAGAEELVFADDKDKVPTSWSPDGKFLLYFTGGGGRYDLWELPLTPERPGAALKAVPLHQTRFNERWGQFSPHDGRWVAYGSDESGRNEIYVAPFSRITEKRQISLNGGQYPRWRQDGKAIFYESQGQLMEAEVRIGGETVEVGSVHAEFARVPTTGGYAYDVSADGQRALVAMPARSGAAPEPVTLIENWPAVLNKK